MSGSTIHGSCVCGAVHYEVRSPYLAFQYCHCSRCRKSTGSAHAANLFVPTAQFEWTAGEEQVRRYELPTAKYWCHGFCDRCGSSIPWASKTGKAFIVPAGTLDADPEMRPTRNIYWASRAPWYVHSSELETFDETPPRP
jgi:hypothetical protein